MPFCAMLTITIFVMAVSNATDEISRPKICHLFVKMLIPIVGSSKISL